MVFYYIDLKVEICATAQEIASALGITLDMEAGADIVEDTLHSALGAKTSIFLDKAAEWLEASPLQEWTCMEPSADYIGRRKVVRHDGKVRRYQEQMTWVEV